MKLHPKRCSFTKNTAKHPQIRAASFGFEAESFPSMRDFGIRSVVDSIIPDRQKMSRNLFYENAKAAPDGTAFTKRMEMIKEKTLTCMSQMLLAKTSATYDELNISQRASNVKYCFQMDKNDLIRFSNMRQRSPRCHGSQGQYFFSRSKLSKNGRC